MEGKKSVEIKAPPERVWEMLALDRMPEWMGDWKSVSFISDIHTVEDKYRLGISARVTEKWAAYDLEIIESLKNKKIMYRSKGIGGGRVTMTLAYTLKPVEGGTELTYKGSYGGWWIFWMNSIFEGKDETSLNNLKTILERTRADDEVVQFLFTGEKVILYNSSAYMSSYGDRLVLTDRRLFLYGKKGFWHPRTVVKREINLSDIVRVFGDPGKRSRLGIMGTPRLVIIPKAGEEWRYMFILDPMAGWNYEKAQNMEMPRVSSWVNAINLELDKSAKGSERKQTT